MKLQYQITVPVFGTIWLLDFHLSFTVQDSIKCNVTFHKLHVFIPPGCTYSVGPTGVIQSLKTIWGCENTLPNLHKSYTTEGLVQVITGYIYIYIYMINYTHKESPSWNSNPLEPDKTQDYHDPPYSSANTSYCQKRIVTLTSLPVTDTMQQYFSATFISLH